MKTYLINLTGDPGFARDLSRDLLLSDNEVVQHDMQHQLADIHNYLSGIEMIMVGIDNLSGRDGLYSGYLAATHIPVVLVCRERLDAERRESLVLLGLELVDWTDDSVENLSRLQVALHRVRERISRMTLHVPPLLARAICELAGERGVARAHLVEELLKSA